jgi:membrane protein implicated in regulation of membrane protease activity
MDPLGQLYLICTVLGWGFIIACFALGQIDHGAGGHGDSAHIGHNGVGGHGAGHGAANSWHGIAHNAHHLANGAHGAHGAEIQAGHGSGHAHSFSDGHGHGGSHGNGHGSGNGHGNGQGHNSNDEAHTSVNPVVRSRENRLYFTIISILNPMSVSIFSGFFGSVGFVTWHYLPFLGYLTLLPAVGGAIVGTELIKKAMAAFAAKLASSSLTKREEAIGRIAEVNTPITEGRLGEVTYVIGTTRFNASAKPAHPGEDFPRGSKVMIVETEGPVVYVECARDIDLEVM